MSNTCVASTVSNTQSGIKVWDPLVRYGHWLLVVGFFVAYFTEDEALSVHVWAGYLVAGVVLARLAWGLVGTSHARFSDFLYRPADMVGYLKGLLKGSAMRYIGHSPAGAAMVFMLLASLVATTGSGLVVYARQENAGPLAGYVATVNAERPAPAVTTAVPAARADYEGLEHEERGDDSGGENRGGGFWKALHEFFANLTVFLVALHVGGVVLASFVHKENLVTAMFSGRKRP